MNGWVSSAHTSAPRYEEPAACRGNEVAARWGQVRPHGVEVAARPRAGTDTPKRICQVKNEKTRHLSTSLVVGDY